jgi:aminoglycoside 3-N-acetyltransferase
VTFARSVYDEMVAAWRNAGLSVGDTVLLHSNASRLLRRIYRLDRAASPDIVIASFLDAVGPAGTIIFPTFNFDFASGKPFDIKRTASQMGILSERARLMPESFRTGHPIYSFVALGARAADFGNLCNSSGYGTDSPFGLLRSWGGRIAVLDLPDQGSMTFYHHVEECLQVNYRYHKRFTAEYTDFSGFTSRQTFGLFVRDLERGVVTDVHNMEALLWEEGIYRGDRPNVGWGLRTVSATDLFERVSSVIRGGTALGHLYVEK